MKKYDNYKDSGVEWIGEIPSHWTLNKVKHNFSFKTGFTPPSGKTEYYENGTHVWINISDLQEKEVHDSVNKITDKAVEDYKPEIIPKGSLLYSFKLSVGRVGFNTVDCYTNEAIFSIDPNSSANLNFFYYSLPEQIIKNANENIYGAKILNQELIKNAFLVAPPPEEQTAIATYLDRKTAEIDDLIADKKRLLELYEEEKTAIINQAVTKGINPDVPMKDSGIEWLGEIPEHWEVKKLRYLCKVTTGAKDTENREDDGEYPFFVRSQTIERISTYSFDGEGILTAGDGVGVCKVWHYVNEKFDFHQRVYLMYDFQEIIGKFLFFYIRQNFIHDVLRLSAKSTVDSLRRNMFLDFQVAFPSNKEEQQSIVQHIETEVAGIDAKKAKTEKLIALLTEYRTALISEVVTGKIKVIP